MRLAVLASHGGSLLQAVIDATSKGALPLEIMLVISNNSSSLALARAKQAAIPCKHLSSATHPGASELDAAITTAVLEARADWILLAGYMKKLGPRTLASFRGRILNIHPALLPSYGGLGFYGRSVHTAVLAAGDRETGATVHLVEGEYDTGPILSQVRLPVKSDDTVESLEARVKTVERRLIVTTLAELAAHKQVAGY